MSESQEKIKDFTDSLRYRAKRNCPFTATIICPPGSEQELNTILTDIATELGLNVEEAFLTVWFDGRAETENSVVEVNRSRDLYAREFKGVFFVVPSAETLPKMLGLNPDYMSHIDMTVTFRPNSDREPVPLVGDYRRRIEQLRTEMRPEELDV